MNIALMTDIKNDFIFGKIKSAMKSNCQFDNAKIGCQMTSVFCNCIDQCFTDFGTKHIHL